jgi:hypothetical protein
LVRELWYVAYHNGGGNRMRVFRTKRLALKLARELLVSDPRQNVEVGPMVEARESVLSGDELRRIVGVPERSSAWQT